MSERDLAVITGAASGLGKAVRERLERLGIPVIAIVRRDCDLGGALRLDADLSDAQDWDAKLPPLLSRFTFERLWFFDIAAILPHGPVLAEEYGAQLREAVAVNLEAPLGIARSLASHAKANSASLDIVHVSSGAAYRPIPQWGAYCVTKAAAAMQMQMLAEEEDFVTTHLIQPGVIATGMQDRLRAEGDPFAAPEAALRSPEEVAADLIEQCGISARDKTP